MKISRKSIISIVCIFLALTGTILFKAYRENIFAGPRERMLARKKAAWPHLQKELENKLVNFGGKVGLVIEDMDTGWVISFNENTLMPSASLVKVPIMLSFFYAAQEGKVNLKEIPKTSFRQDKTRFYGKSVENLFVPMITLSDNSATNILIDSLGFDSLNGYFKMIGLRNTNLSRKMLDFKSRKAGLENYTTAYDMAYILDKLYRKQFLSQKVSDECLFLLSQQKINDRIPRLLPLDKVLVAHKTGLERYVCHDAGIVYTKKGDFLICVLVKHNHRLAKPAKKLISEIALLVYDYYKNL